MWTVWIAAAAAATIAQAPSRVSGASTALGQSAVATGDLTGDGVGDVVLGVPDAASGGQPMSGEVQVFAGPPLVAIASGQGWSSGISLGSALAVGDVTCDGQPDLIVGASGAGQLGAGGVLVFAGPVLGALTPGRADLLLTGEAPWDAVGQALAVAPDVDGDGCDDLLVGARFADDGGALDVGAAYVIRGGARRGTASVGQASYAVLRGSATFAQVGAALAAADVDADGRGDLLIGAPGEGASGTAWVARAVDLRPGMDVPAQLVATGLTAAPGASVGQSVAAGDLDADGWPELVVGAPTVMRQGVPGGAVCLAAGGAIPWAPGTSVDLRAAGACALAPSPTVMLGSTVLIADVGRGPQVIVNGLVPVGGGIRSGRPELWGGPLPAPGAPWAPTRLGIDPIPGRVTMLLPLAAGGDVDGDQRGDLVVLALQASTGQVWATVW